MGVSKSMSRERIVIIYILCFWYNFYSADYNAEKAQEKEERRKKKEKPKKSTVSKQSK